jgi:hypothetical protein
MEKAWTIGLYPFSSLRRPLLFQGTWPKAPTPLPQLSDLYLDFACAIISHALCVRTPANARIVAASVSLKFLLLFEKSSDL